MTQASHSRLIIIANRLPITVRKSDQTGYSYSISSGGLVSGLSGLAKTTKFVWYGWPGLSVPPEDNAQVEADLQQEYGAVPIWVDEDLMELHYNSFSNEILWPLLHYHPSDINFNEQAWQAYTKVNRQFAQTIARNVRDTDMIWVHDYHLMLLPQMLREELGHARRAVKIGFFLHTPFPSREIFRILPNRTGLLQGLMHCDLVGFHTQDYARHFLSACAHIVGSTATPAGITYQGRDVHVAAHPIGIDPSKFVDGLRKEQVRSRIQSLKSRYHDKRIFIGVDRLDYIKGIPQKLRAFEILLERHPEWIGKAILMQIAVPSRESVKEYQNLRSTVSELVGRINGRFGAVDYTPIKFVHNSVSFEELLALYSVADACFITSTRDGMNLVAYEYIMCQQESHGQLILSEFTGAAQCLNGSINVNPWDTDDLVDSLLTALTMSADQRRRNHATMYEYVNMYTSAYWGQTFVQDLISTEQKCLVKPRRRGLNLSPTNLSLLPSPISVQLPTPIDSPPDLSQLDGADLSESDSLSL